jgi:hypothetical protein
MLGLLNDLQCNFPHGKPRDLRTRQARAADARGLPYVKTHHAMRLQQDVAPLRGISRSYVFPAFFHLNPCEQLLRSYLIHPSPPYLSQQTRRLTIVGLTTCACAGTCDAARCRALQVEVHHCIVGTTCMHLAMSHGLRDVRKSQKQVNGHNQVAISDMLRLTSGD